MADKDADAGQGFKIKIGTYEEGRAAIGMRGPVYEAGFDISNPTSQLYCSQIEDGNPSYWDEDYAKKTWGGLLAPPALMLTFGRRLAWHPDGASQPPQSIALAVPLPGTSVINAASETTFARPLKIGDRLHAYDEIEDISAEKTTKLGVGHFVSAVSNYFNQNDELVGKNKNVVFRFTPHPSK